MEEFGYSERCIFTFQDSHLYRARKTVVCLWTCSVAVENSSRAVGKRPGFWSWFRAWSWASVVQGMITDLSCSGYDHGSGYDPKPQLQNKGIEHNWFQEPEGQKFKENRKVKWLAQYHCTSKKNKRAELEEILKVI